MKEIEKQKASKLSDFKFADDEEATDIDAQNDDSIIVDTFDEQNDGGLVNGIDLDGYIIADDVKSKMHANDQIAEEILSGKKFWDIDQAAFLLNPLVRPESKEIGGQGELSFDDTEEEKQKIINAFDELVPEKEYKINYVKTGNSGSIRSTMNRGRGETSEHIIGSGRMKIVEENSLPPLKRIEPLEIAGTGKSKTKKQKSRLADLVNDRKNSAKETATNIESTEGSSSGNIMVQIASVPTKGGAEVEYRRISNKNKFIKNFGKRIYKVDLGKQKGSTYRIQIGPFKNNAEAQKVISALKNNGCFAYISR
mgnify:CR=1 FL=1